MSFEKMYHLLRVSQWTKSVFVLLGVIYTNMPGYWFKAFVAALAFCLIASTVYIYNDLQDIEEDKNHPQKANRLLASEKISVSFALGMLLVCLFLGLLLSAAVSLKLTWILVGYLFINFLYNHWLRQIPFLDVLCIASGFMLRVFAGTIGIGLPITWWLTVIATLLSLFIALCKRRLEIQLNRSHRPVLKKYDLNSLNMLIASTASSCFISYFLYTVYAREQSFYFLLTLPFCALGLWRFASLKAHSDNDDPFSLFLADSLSRINLVCFAVLTIMALSQ